MPNLQDIEEFASELRRLGNEPEILKKRGEAVDEPFSIQPEEPGEAEISEGAEVGEPEISAAGTAELDEGLPPDIDQLLAGLGEEPFEGPAGIPEGEPSPTESPAGQPGESESSDDSFFDEFLRESAEAEETEMTAIGEQPIDEEAAQSPPAEAGGGEPAATTPGISEPEFQAPDFEEPERHEPPAAELPDENLFFDIPSPEDLGPPEELGFPDEEPPAEAGMGGSGPSEPEPETGLPEGTPQGAEPPVEEDFSFEIGSGEPPSEEGEVLEGLDVTPPADEQAGAEQQAAAEAFEAASAGEGGEGFEDFASPEGGAGTEESGNEFELPEGIELPEEFGAAPEMPTEESAGDFELPSFEDEASTAGPTPPAGEGEEAGFEVPDFGGDFELPEVPAEESPIGEIGLPTEELAPPGEAAAAGMSTDLEPPEESIFEESAFEMPTEESLAEPQAGSAAASGQSPGAAPTGTPAAAAGEQEEFGLGDIGQEFGLTGESQPPPSEEELNPALAVGGPTPEEEAPAPETPAAGVPVPTDIKISDRDFEHIQRTLSSLPRNLRITIEELIGEQDLGGRRLSQLVALLVRGAPPHEIAELTSRIVGRKITIPVSYEKKTGLEFEEERATFGYRFRNNILPILRVFLAGAAIIALLIFLGYRFVYRPIHAYSLYAQGYHQLQNDSFMTANHDFNSATRQWQMKNWYYRYAEGYLDKKQYSFASQKYEQLLKVWPGDRKGVFDYANMESKILGNYTKANTLLDTILNKNQWDYQGLMEAGDNYLRWGRQDPKKLDLARRDFAMLLQHYGTSNAVLFKMLRYFILTDNLQQVEILKNQFQADPRIKVDPLAYADLGGYLIDKNRLSDVHGILFRALKVDPTLPETNYNLARYFQKIGDYPQEGVALERTLTELQQATPLSQERLGMLVDTYDRIGENLYREKRYLDAEQAYNKGISRYETALKQNQLKPAAEFGKLYANLGDLNYYISGKYDQALRLYQQAANNGYQTPELLYKEGYVHYRNQNYRSALLRFMNAAGSFSENRDLLYATANTFFKRNDFSAAEGYYLNLLNILETERRSIATFQPDQVPAQHDLLVDLMKVYNNLGVTLYELSKRTSDAQKYSRALVNLTRSMESFDQLTRNPVTLEKSSAINLAFINTKNILYPTPDYQVQIYSDLPQDLSAKSF